MGGQTLPGGPGIDRLAISIKITRFHPLVGRPAQGRHFAQERLHKGVLVMGETEAGLKSQHAGGVPDINRLSDRLDYILIFLGAATTAPAFIFKSSALIAGDLCQSFSWILSFRWLRTSFMLSPFQLRMSNK